MSVGLGEGVLGDPDIMMVMCVVEYKMILLVHDIFATKGYKHVIEKLLAILTIDSPVE
jgi:hypothetical protein